MAEDPHYPRLINHWQALVLIATTAVGGVLLVTPFETTVPAIGSGEPVSRPLWELTYVFVFFIIALGAALFAALRDT